jgi:hypothetical protein
MATVGWWQDPKRPKRNLTAYKNTFRKFMFQDSGHEPHGSVCVCVCLV